MKMYQNLNSYHTPSIHIDSIDNKMTKKKKNTCKSFNLCPTNRRNILFIYLKQDTLSEWVSF